MNLCDRLETKRPPCVWTGYFFKYRGCVIQGKGELILRVAERFSSRFGQLNGAQADALYKRLSEKYATYPGSLSIFRALELGYAARHRIAHPLRLGCIGKQAELETRLASGSYCLIDSARNPCRVCGKPTQCQIVRQETARAVSASKNGLCLHARCQSLAEIFPKAFSSKKYYQFPLIPVLQELSKNDQDNQNKRRLEEYFVRHARQVRKWRDRLSDGKNRGEAG